MSSRKWEFRIQDMLDSISKIEKYVEESTFEQFIIDEKTSDAVIRQLTIIGEAASHIPDNVTSKALDIPWRSIKGIRNVVVHEYFGVNFEILWQTVKHNLPQLKFNLNSLRQQLGIK